MAYAVAATVRLLLTEITTDVASDVVIASYSTDVVDPEIDGWLSSVGAPFDDTPAVVILIANRWVAAEIVNARIAQDDDESKWAAGQHARGLALIKAILSGEIDLSADDTGDGGTITRILTVTDHSVQPSTGVFVGTNSAGWNSVAETRDASSTRSNT